MTGIASAATSVLIGYLAANTTTLHLGSGVARLEEALRLRAGGITKPVLLLEGFFDARDLPTISAQHFHTAVHNEEQLAALEEASLDEPVTVWMKLDTGMHRLGVRPSSSSSSSRNNIISNRQMTGLKRQKPTAERPRNERGGA